MSSLNGRVERIKSEDVVEELEKMDNLVINSEVKNLSKVAVKVRKVNEEVSKSKASMSF